MDTKSAVVGRHANCNRVMVGGDGSQNNYKSKSAFPLPPVGSFVPGALYKVRSRAHEGHRVSAQRALQGSETETRELLEGTKRQTLSNSI